MDKLEKSKDIFFFLDKAAKAFEVIIALLLLIIIAIKLFDMIFELASLNITILSLDFERVMTILFNLVIGVEFARMLYKQNPETVIYVLLFAIARHIILFYESILHLLIGVIAIAGLFAIKKFLLIKTPNQ